MSLFFGLTLIISMVFRGIGGSIIAPTIEELKEIYFGSCDTDTGDSRNDDDERKQREVAEVLAKAMNRKDLYCPRIDSVIGDKFILKAYKTSSMSSIVFFRRILSMVANYEGWEYDTQSANRMFEELVVRDIYREPPVRPYERNPVRQNEVAMAIADGINNNTLDKIINKNIISNVYNSSNKSTEVFFYKLIEFVGDKEGWYAEPVTANYTFVNHVKRDIYKDGGLL